ncbi:hypothetical protein BGZ76_002235, partial [Entomortierella beljakovae]
GCGDNAEAEVPSNIEVTGININNEQGPSTSELRWSKKDNVFGDSGDEDPNDEAQQEVEEEEDIDGARCRSRPKSKDST